MFLKILLITAILLSLSMLGMALNILVKKNGRFPQTSIGKNKAMAQRGITCVKHDEIKCHRNGNTEGHGCSCG